MSYRKLPYDKTVEIRIAFPVLMDDDRLHDLKEHAARKLAEEIEKEILGTPGWPNWFATPSGFEHQPGMYLCRVDFRVLTRLEGQL